MLKNIESYYENKAATYDDDFDSLYFRLCQSILWEYLGPYVPSNPDSFVLDAGGGTGRWAIPMAKKPCKVVMVDISRKMLKNAQKKIASERLQKRVDIVRSDISTLNFQEDSFDMAICDHVLFIFERPVVVLKELTRVLKRGAVLVVSIPNRYVQSLSHLSSRPTYRNLDVAFNVLLCKQNDYLDYNATAKINSLTPDEFRHVLQEAGLVVQKIMGMGVASPLRISPKFILKSTYSKSLLRKLLKLELALTKEPDGLSLANYLHAVAMKP